jgi:hypothetical protein
MSLSCSIGDDGDFEWYYDVPEDFTTLQTLKRKRCSSCKKLIDIGSSCLKFDRTKYDENGSEFPQAPMFMCESCGDQYFNLTALKFCIAPNENVPQLLKEYAEEYGKGPIT